MIWAPQRNPEYYSFVPKKKPKKPVDKFSDLFNAKRNKSGRHYDFSKSKTIKKN